jgi:hypothetical protein
MIISVECIDVNLAEKAAQMLAASIADQGAGIEVVQFEINADLDSEDEHDYFRHEMNEWIVWSLLPVLRRKHTAAIVPAYVTTLMAKYSNVPALNAIRNGVHPLYLPDIQIVIDVSPESTFNGFNDYVKTIYPLTDLVREQEVILTLADNAANTLVLNYAEGDDLFDMVEEAASFVWETAPNVV